MVNSFLMPRLHVVRERRPFNVWDQIDRAMIPHARLFVGRDGSEPQVCNLGPGLNNDRTMLVTGWYVRTTMPRGPDRDRSFHNAIATLVVGVVPIRQLSLAELALRDERSEIEETGADRVESVGALAQSMYLEHENHVPPGHPVGIKPSHKTWGDLSAVDKNRWIAAADVAMRIVKPRPHVIVPVRQHWHVEVDNFDPWGWQIWVHVVGVTVRDVC